MRLYAGSSLEFIDDSTHNRIATRLKDAFQAAYRREASPGEVNSWRNSLRAMSQVLDAGKLHDHGILLEYELPLSSKRLDCLITGQDFHAKNRAVIVELKQWEKCEETDGEKVVTFVGGGHRTVLHPAVQVGQYRRYLEDVHTVFHESAAPVSLEACSYLHNYSYGPTDALLAAKFSEVMMENPVFTGDDVTQLTQYLQHRMGKGNGMEALARIEKSKYRPSKKLLAHVGGVLQGQSKYVLLDNQLVAFDRVLAEAKAGFRDKKKSAILIRGGPGTGKSVIALNLMSALSSLGLNAHYATGSKAFTETLRQIVGKRAATQVRYFNSYPQAQINDIDVLICDEAHRIRETSNSRFTPAAKRSGLRQLDELFNASKVAVFFVDDRQIVRPGEIGSADEILASARKQGCRIFEFKLESQFRCGGSDGFINWINNTLEIERTANVLWNTQDAYDFQIVSTPEELDAKIKAKLGEGFDARLTAGFCWEWSDPDRDGNLVDDVVVGTFRRPWNAKSGAGKRLAKGIPPENLWAHASEGINQVGCIYTAQGFEFDYVGVIVGNDLVYRPGIGWIGNKEHSHDSVVKRSKDFVDLVKNTYRVLLTRGMKGCYVHFMDKETENFFRSRTENAAHF